MTPFSLPRKCYLPPIITNLIGDLKHYRIFIDTFSFVCVLDHRSDASPVRVEIVEVLRMRT
jgi:hypothetical protein